jgi:hypothetical protein
MTIPRRRNAWTLGCFCADIGAEWSMVSETTPIERVSRMLAEVRALTDKVLARKGTWTASAPEWDFLCELSAVTGQTLPDEARDSGAVVLGFLGLARFGLEATVRLLTGVPGLN